MKWLVLVIVAAFILKPLSTSPYVPKEAPKPQIVIEFKIDPRLQKISDDLGIANIERCHPQVGGTQRASELSSYDPNIDTIHIYPVFFTRSVNEQYIILAHEYMHCVWDHEDHANLEPFLTKFYLTSPDLQRRMDDWGSLSLSQLLNELDSVMCTEVLDSRLGTFLNYCRTYLPNRSVLISTL